jgi:hypothetical protein
VRWEKRDWGLAGPVEPAVRDRGREVEALDGGRSDELEGGRERLEEGREELEVGLGVVDINRHQ